jgi:NADP-dependent 3-hydroxy acid dehydrogenase YdfG
VVLTGASGGIGLAITEALCAAGAQVLAVARHEQALTPLLERYPIRCAGSPPT